MQSLLSLVLVSLTLLICGATPIHNASQSVRTSSSNSTASAVGRRGAVAGGSNTTAASNSSSAMHQIGLATQRQHVEVGRLRSTRAVEQASDQGVPRAHMSNRINRAWFRRKYGSSKTATSPRTAHVQPVPVQATRFLRAEPQSCTCHTQSCTVEDALSFMNCIDSACASQQCGCTANQFIDSCHRMRRFCSDLHFYCSADHVAVATSEAALNETLASLDRAPLSGELSVTPYGENPEVHGDGKYFYRHAPAPAPAPALAPAPAPAPLPQPFQMQPLEESDEKHVFSVEETRKFYYHRLRQLKLEKCRHEFANSNGWVNARARLQEVLVKIHEDMTELVNRRIALPEMHCEKDFEEFHHVKETHSSTNRQGLWMASLLIAAVFA